MSFPLLFTVGVHTSSGVEDYDTANTYTPAKDAAGTPARVYGWSVPQTTEPKLAGRDQVQVDVELLVPPGFTVTPYDLVDLPEGQYEVIGEAEDCDTGPFGFQPGKVINLRRVLG